MNAQQIGKPIWLRDEMIEIYSLILVSFLVSILISSPYDPIPKNELFKIDGKLSSVEPVKGARSSWFYVVRLDVGVKNLRFRLSSTSKEKNLLKSKIGQMVSIRWQRYRELPWPYAREQKLIRSVYSNKNAVLIIDRLPRSNTRWRRFWGSFYMTMIVAFASYYILVRPAFLLVLNKIRG